MRTEQITSNAQVKTSKQVPWITEKTTNVALNFKLLMLAFLTVSQCVNCILVLSNNAVCKFRAPHQSQKTTC